MKWIRFVCVFLSTLGMVAAAQTPTNDMHLVPLATSGVTSDAFEQTKAKAEKGDAAAECDLGCYYITGQGVSPSSVEAAKWFLKAAEQGDFVAQNNIAKLYADGDGVAKNEPEAAKWYHRAAEQGYVYSEYTFASILWNGNGVSKDYVQAYKWMNLALAQGSEYARQYLPIIESQMTAEQVAEAQRLTREFTPRKENSASSTSHNNPTATGTGFFITDDGYLVSNYHVVKDAVKVRLLTSAGLIEAKVFQVDQANDLALLKADGKFSSLPISSSRSAQLGGTVATVGFPDIGLQGFAPKLAKGEIASLSGAADDPRYFQISVPVQPGNSGGALVDERGNVIGIVSAKLDASAALAASGALPENVNYAVKSSLLLSFLESVPAVSAKLKTPVTADRKFEEVVKSAQDAAVLVLVY